MQGSKIAIQEGAIDILSPEGAVKYLGKQIAMENMHETDFKRRMSAAWACFGRHRVELTNKNYALRDRLRLFTATVTATALYGCETWVLKLDQQKRLKTTQRKMLRAVLGVRRTVIVSSSSSANSEVSSGSLSSEEQELGPWALFLKRTAKMVEAQLEKTKLKDWCTLWRRRQWKWAGKVVQESRHKWSFKALLWDPVVDCTNCAGRARARPRKRWEDDIKNAVKTALPEETRSWQELAKDVQRWRQIEELFVEGQ